MTEEHTDIIQNNEQSMQNIHKESDNDLIHVSFSSQGLKYEIKPKFKSVLEESRKLAHRSQELMDGATAENIDEDQLSQIRNDMKPIKQYRRDVEETVKDVRRVFDDTKKSFTDHVNQLLDDADFDVIEKNDEKAKKLNKDVQALRLKNNWQKVEEEFKSALDMYPDLLDTYPNLLSFETFQDTNDRLATGAKSWKLNDDVVNTIKNYIQTIYNNNEVLERLESDYEKDLKKRYNETGDIKSALDLEKRLKKQEEEVIKRQKEKIRREAEEQVRKEKQQRQMEENAKKRREQEEKARQQKSQGVADSPFGIQTKVKPSKTQLVTQNVGLKNVAKRMQNAEWSLSDLEAMDLIHRFITGVYSQNPDIVEHTSSPGDVMDFIKEVTDHTE